jgi:hypothetical protein
MELTDDERERVKLGRIRPVADVSMEERTPLRLVLEREIRATVLKTELERLEYPILPVEREGKARDLAPRTPPSTSTSVTRDFRRRGPRL